MHVKENGFIFCANLPSRLERISLCLSDAENVKHKYAMDITLKLHSAWFSFHCLPCSDTVFLTAVCTLVLGSWGSAEWLWGLVYCLGPLKAKTFPRMRGNPH
jgi:hypothetical protein